MTQIYLSIRLDDADAVDGGDGEDEADAVHDAGVDDGDGDDDADAVDGGDGEDEADAVHDAGVDDGDGDDDVTMMLMLSTAAMAKTKLMLSTTAKDGD
jgi:hypothetical protein